MRTRSRRLQVGRFPAQGSLPLTLVLAATLACAPSADQEPAPDTTVDVTGGTVVGTLGADGSVRVFRAIPYAAPPVGEHRWRPPQPVATWEGERAADTFSVGCMQALRPEGSFYGPGTGEMSEDCLYLNVWAPVRADAPRPVLVWIHGGGLRNGDGARPIYDGGKLVERGAVVVTLNYRLGPFGFLAHPALSAEDEHGSSGNYGLLDQIAALRWVRDNIAAFGGDPERVTIFGESAGSLSVSYLQASPLAAGLFHRAIGQSGSALRASPPLSEAEAAGERFVAAMLAGGETASQPSVEALREASAERIVETFRTPGVDFPSRGNVDGWFLPRSVAEIFAAGEQNDVPVIVGWNHDEGPSLAGDTGPKNRAELEAWAKGVCGPNSSALLSTYPAASDEEARTAYLAAYGVSSFGAGARRWAELMSTASSPAFLYQFVRVPPGPGGQRYGAYHAAEIPYAFDNLDQPGLEGEGVVWEDGDRQLSDLMASYWVRFAATGDPNGEGLPEWPAYDAGRDLAMVFDAASEARVGVRKEELDVFALCHSGS